MTELRHRRSSIPELKHSSTTDLCDYDRPNSHDDEDHLLLHKNRTNLFQFSSLFYTSTRWRKAQMMHNEEEPNIIEHFGSEVFFTSQFHYTVSFSWQFKLLRDKRLILN